MTSGSTPDWQLVREHFDRVVELDGGERQRYLDRLALEEPTLAVQVRRLVAADDSAGDTLEAGVAAAWQRVRTGPDEGLDIGPFRTVQRLGEGGMGSVFLAERRQGDVEQRVAVKLLHRDLVSPDMLIRFQQERRILARLDHANIARFLDGGTTDEGLPYLAMQYIEGKPLDAFCAEHELALDERLELFLQVCDAVEFAHRNLVVHRDLKPSNILVTADGQPRLLDFGIAKVIDPELGGETTKTMMRVMTPDFACPEQMTGEPITAASDVYSLGMVLYLLLTGRKAYHVTGSPADLVATVCSLEPPPPSTVVEATSVAGLRGDLDAIILKALRKDPKERYPTVAAFAADLRRLRDGLPVEASSGNLAYRTVKFIRRHKVGVGLAALMATIVITGVAATVWQAHIAHIERDLAQRRFTQLRTLANAVIFEYHDAIADLPGSLTARQLLVADALEFLDGLAREATEDAQLMLEIAEGYLRVGDIQGLPSTANLGDPAAAEASYRKALTAVRSIPRGTVPETRPRRLEAKILHHQGEVASAMGSTDAAYAAFHEALEIGQEVASQIPRDTSALLDLAATSMALGAMHSWNGDTSAALDAYGEARLHLEQALGLDPESAAVRARLGVCLNGIGNTLGWAGDSEGAVETLEQGLDLLATTPEASAADPDLVGSIIVGTMWLGENQLELGRAEEAEKAYRRAFGLAAGLAANDPRDAADARRADLLAAKIGDALLAQGDTAAALSQYRQALARQERYQQRFAGSAVIHADLANSHEPIGNALPAAGDVSAAVGAHQRALAIRRRTSADDPADIMALRNVATSEHAVAEAMRRSSGSVARTAETACDHDRNALGILRQLDDQGRLLGADEGTLAEIIKRLEGCAGG